MKSTTSVALTLALTIGLVACEKASSPLRPEPSVSPPVTSPEGLASTSGLSQSEQAFPFKRILCFGDSITYGVTSRTAEGWQSLANVEGYVPKLRKLLKQEYGEGIQLINSGIGAENSTDGVERLDGEVAIYNPDLVLLLEGIIDVGNDDPAFNLVRQNLEKMIDIVRRRDSQVIVGTYPRLHPDGFRINGIDNVPRLNDVIRDQARRQRALVADHEAAARGDLSGQGPDGLHPNDKGYGLMSQTWLEVIQEMVAGLST